ncbi:uncharacterized protein N7483_007225 [Penicillium malachiteum]|uniref:uncharacterized protein n=1 Tax=Penicillium malachiteum TaxID=1324776 RepID=UPI00254862F7|nr:uncharacterized protein N7483_007225 [Penicillium malachiteum]KAJ5725868.1 hypothetical protein N7483_007225 [Penicillium malachiteum]
MSTWFSQDDKYRDEIVQLENEKYGANHHRHITHDSNESNEGPRRVPHREPHNRRSPTSSKKSKESSGSAAKRHQKSNSTSAHVPSQPELEEPEE